MYIIIFKKNSVKISPIKCKWCRQLCCTATEKPKRRARLKLISFTAHKLAKGL